MEPFAGFPWNFLEVWSLPPISQLSVTTLAVIMESLQYTSQAPHMPPWNPYRNPDGVLSPFPPPHLTDEETDEQ